MKAMILAAGRGERMRPLTDKEPKPLLQVGEYRLIEYHIIALARIGINELVVNTGWLANRIHDVLGNGSHYEVNITYSDEGYPALETAGAIINALPLLGSEPFIVINGDVFTDYDFSQLKLSKGDLGHLVLVKNPPHNKNGDYSIDTTRLVFKKKSDPGLTFSGIALYHPDLFVNLNVKRLRLKPVFDSAIASGTMSATEHTGLWYDIGTVERLEKLHNALTGEDFTPN